jgi:asparagine synthase (glutamine-hydrolysing)
MCGIGGIYNIKGKPVDTVCLNAMTKAIRHRGPDDEGFLLVNTLNKSHKHCYDSDSINEIKASCSPLHNDFQANLGFGFRRLSIIDLSPKGHQPMSNEDETIWIVFNGEIYNYIEIREELKQAGYTFHSGSDTEVIIKAYQHWGENCLQRFNGMWSFALWDSKQNKLFCARDRFGVKPFNYYFDGNTFIFGSEVKQILANNIDKTINTDVIYKSFAIGSFLLNSDNTYFDKIQILPHSHYLTIKDGHFSITQYYDLPVAQFEKSTLNFADACEQYKSLFTDAIKLRMRSDVEVGSTLSGGLDSSAIVTLASNYTPRDFKTFSSYFTYQPQYDERKYIDLVVKKTNSIAHYVSAPASDVINDLGKITWHHDYPVMGSSPVAQYYVMKLSHQNNVTVLLDGQGSDELTGGYNHTFYRYYADLIRNNNLSRFTKEFIPYLKHNQKGSAVSKILKTLLILGMDEKSIYKSEAKHKFNLLNLNNRSINLNEIKDLKDTSKLSNFLYNLVMSTSIQTLLHFEDRNSMAHSIESRVPFLDYRFVEFAFSLPSHYKVHKNYGKYIHREALKSIVPDEILNRKDKIGFLAPGENFWMRNEMKDFYYSLINSNDFKNRSIINVNQVKSEYEKYLKGDNSHAQMLWMVMALEVWFQQFID